MSWKPHVSRGVSRVQKGNRQNIQSLGLEPRNYVPQPDRLDACSWEGAAPPLPSCITCPGCVAAQVLPSITTASLGRRAVLHCTRSVPTINLAPAQGFACINPKPYSDPLQHSSHEPHCLSKPWPRALNHQHTYMNTCFR